jgi:Na+-transporting NADH:ubiquinone oxidoreductase subunit A
MDIYPLQLLKSIMVGDIEAMENLGIYEVDEEDLALCEFICTSKMPIQKIIRQGLDLTRAETA